MDKQKLPVIPSNAELKLKSETFLAISKHTSRETILMVFTH